MRLATPLAVIFLSVAAAPADARIVPFKSIAGVEIGTSESELRKDLGHPPTVRDGPLVGTRTFVYKRKKLEVMLRDGRVGAITTRSRSERSRGGLGVGMKLATLKRKLRGERCEKTRRYTVCELTRRKIGMEYTLRRDRVVAVTLWAGSAAAQPPQ